MSTSFKDTLIPVLERISREPCELSRIIDKNFGSRTNLFEADAVKLETITKSSAAAELFPIIAALASRKVTEGFKFGKHHSEKEICDFLTGFYMNLSVEIVTILPIGKDGKVLSVEALSEGTVNFSSIIPRQIIEKLASYGSDKFIMAHNHPGGVPEPSDGDILSTIKLVKALDACGIKLVSHYVIAGGVCNKIKFQES